MGEDRAEALIIDKTSLNEIYLKEI